LENRRVLDPWLESQQLKELRVRKADDEWLKGELEELAKRQEGNWHPDQSEGQGALYRELPPTTLRKGTVQGRVSFDRTNSRMRSTSSPRIMVGRTGNDQLRGDAKLSKGARKRARAKERSDAPEHIPHRFKRCFTNERTQKLKMTSYVRIAIRMNIE